MWAVEAVTGFVIPVGDRGEEGAFLVDVPVTGLCGKLFQHWVLRLPIKLYG